MHRVGEKLFVDYAEQAVPIVNGNTKEIKDIRIFVVAMEPIGVPIMFQPPDSPLFLTE